MASPDTIQAHIVALKARAEAVKTHAEVHLSELETLAVKTLSTTDPLLSFWTTPTAKSSDNTVVTADFASGLAYPDIDAMFVDINAGAYDSVFLEYLEQHSRVNPTATWVSTIDALRATYQAATLTAAKAFTDTLVPQLGNGAAYTAITTMDLVTADVNATQTADYALTRNAILNDISDKFQAEAHTTGVAIEDIRSKIKSELMAVHSDYNNAVLDMARTDFQAVIATANNIHDRYAQRVTRVGLVGDQNYKALALAQEVNLLDMDKELATLRDTIRRTSADNKLALEKGRAQVAYLNNVLNAAQLGTGSFGIYTESGEA